MHFKNRMNQKSNKMKQSRIENRNLSKDRGNKII